MPSIGVLCYKQVVRLIFLVPITYLCDINGFVVFTPYAGVALAALYVWRAYGPSRLLARINQGQINTDSFD